MITKLTRDQKSPATNMNLFDITEKLISPYFVITGIPLPYIIQFSAMAVSPDSKGVLLFGGGTIEPIHGEESILELRAITNKPWFNSWNVLNVTLKNKRGGHVVIPLQ